MRNIKRISKISETKTKNPVKNKLIYRKFSWIKKNNFVHNRK